MNSTQIGYDVNLPLPSDFSKAIGCEVSAYDNLKELIEAFNQKKIMCMFAPVGTLLALNEYEIIAQAVLSPENKMTMESHFISLHDISIPNLPQHVLGRVNPYCTTSFWGRLR